VTGSGVDADDDRRDTSGQPTPERGGYAGRDERYHQLVELAPDGILIHDGERVLLANTAAARLAGATHLDQLIGLPIDSFLKPPYLKGVEARLMAPGELVSFVAPVRDTFRRLDGSEVEVEVTAIAFMDGRRTSAHLVIRDITDRLAVQLAARQVQEQLRQAQRMEAVGALAGGVAHEVNNMMSVVLGFSDFILQDPSVPEERLADVRQIIKAAERAAGVTRQLLAFSRRGFYHPVAFDLGEAVHALEPVVRRLLGESRNLEVALDASPCVWADRGQFDQVIVNLALNARDAMPAGGTLTITAAERQVQDGATAYADVVIPPGAYALVVVRDTGTGMDAPTEARIFEPFFTTKPVGQGTGLGLAAVYGILRQNQGYITVENRPGHGVAFTLYLPLAPAAAVVVVEQPDPGQPAIVPDLESGATILLVEDEEAVRAIAMRSLELGGFRVLQAADGVSALEAIGRHGPPQLVLTDLMMPGMGGAELGRRLRERWPALPILFMSGYSAEDLHRQGAVESGKVTVQKPFTPDGLIRSVAAALARVATG
jgi:two-component system, cell cycle sensor histidine kinase and response regulator CckA